MFLSKGYFALKPEKLNSTFEFGIFGLVFAPTITLNK